MHKNIKKYKIPIYIIYIKYIIFLNEYHYTHNIVIYYACHVNITIQSLLHECLMLAIANII